jgi:hypothetical protein
VRAGRGEAQSLAAATVWYFAVVFVLGFVLGVARTLAQASIPTLDRVTAVLIELPIILTASWLICARLVKRFRVAPRVGVRLIMGGVALMLLLSADAALSLGAGRLWRRIWRCMARQAIRLVGPARSCLG